MSAIKWEEVPVVPASEIEHRADSFVVRTDVGAAVRRINEIRRQEAEQAEFVVETEGCRNR